MKKLFLSIGLLLSVSFASEMVLWQGNPIPISINVNDEKRIDFPEAIVDLNVNGQIQQMTDILLTPEGRLFWKPKTTYSKARVKAVSVTGTLYLIDISSVNDGGNKEALQIVDPVLNGSAPHAKIGPSKSTDFINQAQNNKSNPNVTQSKPLPQGIPDFLKRDNSREKSQKRVGNDYVSMARFAMAHFSGPDRLIPKMKASQTGISAAPRNWVRLHGNNLQVKPLRSWVIDGHYVSAFHVKNRSLSVIEFDPRGLRGNFEFVATMNTILSPKGSRGDETLWVLISREPFSKAVRQ